VGKAEGCFPPPGSLFGEPWEQSMTARVPHRYVLSTNYSNLRFDGAKVFKPLKINEKKPPFLSQHLQIFETSLLLWTLILSHIFGKLSFCSSQARFQVHIVSARFQVPGDHGTPLLTSFVT